MKFSENLKTQRILNGVKQEDIAILCDVTRSAVSNWENGRRLPQLSTIQTLTKFFNITIEELMGSDIQFIEYLEKESIVTPDEPKHFSKIPMIFALLTLVVVTLLTILIVPVVKDKYINNGNVNEVEYIDANSISKVSLILEYYSEVVSIDFVERLASHISNEIQTDNGKIYIIENLSFCFIKDYSENSGTSLSECSILSLSDVMTLSAGIFQSILNSGASYLMPHSDCLL